MIKVGDKVYIDKKGSSAMGNDWSGTVERIDGNSVTVSGVGCSLDRLTKYKSKSY